MQDFITKATSQLGVDASAASKATGGLLNMIQGQIGDGEFAKLMDKLPGAGDLVQQAQGTPKSGGGMLGGLMNKASAMVGGGAGQALGLASVAEQSGLGMDKLGSLGSLLVNFIKEKAGADMFNTIMEKMPDLKKLVG